MSDAIDDIVLIGPVRAGKSTVGRLLAQRLGVPRVSFDAERWRYYAEIGYDEALAREIRLRGGFLALVLYWNLFDAHAAERLLAEHRGCVVDFGAAIYWSSEALGRARRALQPYRNVVLLMPSPDLDEAVAILAGRDVDPPSDLNFDFNAFFLRHPTYAALARLTVFTKGKTPEETRDEILARAHF
ncbi:MAG TPA: shikimate kinase [Anaerolineae bacterium]